ncbi:MAG TPA: hypothetical protein VFV34_21535 [Blastocatellia bacterium]|nr:hypothetical protein [Blastocatellia bacterium]
MQASRPFSLRSFSRTRLINGLSSIVLRLAENLASLRPGALRHSIGMRQVIASVLALNLMLPPGSDALLAESPRVASAWLDGATAPIRNLSAAWKSLFGSKPARRQRQTMADRVSRVALIRSLSPEKRVGYQNETVTFTAIAADASGATVQGVRFSYASSDTTKLAIDDSGMALLKNPGMVWVTVRAGAAEARVPVLIRPGSRPAQSNSQFDADQLGVSASGATTGSTGPSGSTEIAAAPPRRGGMSVEAEARSTFSPRRGEMFRSSDGDLCRDGVGTASNAAATNISPRSGDPQAKARATSGPVSPRLRVAGSPRLISALAATPPQGACPAAYDSSDVGYDELWSQPANQVGLPPNRPIEPMKIGTVLPEQNNFNLAIPIYGLSGRGLGAGLTLHYNSRVWFKHGTAITYNAVNSWPMAGFSLGFGRIFTYGSGANTKYVLIDPDGTRHYLGTGSDTTVGTYQTSDGGHITFVGSKSAGGSLYSNDGTKVTISVINNMLLPTRIQDSNGNYLSLAPDNHYYAE